MKSLMKSFSLQEGLKFFLTTIIFFCLKIEAHAGGSTGGGNSVRSPKGEIHFFDLMKIPTREIFDPKMTMGYRRLLQVMDRVEAFSGTTIIPRLYNQVSGTSHDKILEALETLTFYKIPGPLPDLDDKGTVVFKKNFNGKIERLALQSQWDNTVLVDRNLFEKLSKNPLHVAAFFMHEALIKVYWNNELDLPLESTENISNAVNAIFQPKAPATISVKMLARYFADAGIATAPGKYVGYETKKGMATAQITFNDFLVYSNKDQSIHLFSGNRNGGSSGYKLHPGICYEDCQIWEAKDLVERAEGREWPARIVMVLSGIYKSFEMMEITSDYKHFDILTQNLNSLDLEFLERP